MTKETEKNKFGLPPVWCGTICKNAMSEKCIENCAIKRDCSSFKLKRGISLNDMPRFPIDNISEMTKEEKFTSVAVYTAKTVDYLQGVEDEPEYRPIPRRNPNYSNGSKVPQAIQIESLLPLLLEEDSPHTDWKEPSDTKG